jgi:hypothetical protein
MSFDAEPRVGLSFDGRSGALLVSSAEVMTAHPPQGHEVLRPK